MQEDNIFSDVFLNPGTSVGYNAMLLALTRSITDENIVKQTLRKQGIRFAVTEIGGKANDEFQTKLNKAVIGAGLNENVVNKNSHDLHAILHASEEAKRGLLVNTSSSTHLALKVAIVRDDSWIAVAMFGESSVHLSTSHERCSLGVMHI